MEPLPLVSSFPRNCHPESRAAQKRDMRFTTRSTGNAVFDESADPSPRSGFRLAAQTPPKRLNRNKGHQEKCWWPFPFHAVIPGEVAPPLRGRVEECAGPRSESAYPIGALPLLKTRLPLGFLYEFAEPM